MASTSPGGRAGGLLLLRVALRLQGAGAAAPAPERRQREEGARGGLVCLRPVGLLFSQLPPAPGGALNLPFSRALLPARASPSCPLGLPLPPKTHPMAEC